MGRSANEQILHDWVIRTIQARYSRIYSEVHINPSDEKNFEFKGKYPDAVFVNYGQVVQIIEVETNDTIILDSVEKWRGLSDLGAKLVLLVPKDVQNIARDLCWKDGLASKIKIASFDFKLNL